MSRDRIKAPFREVSAANKHESTVALPLIDTAHSRGFAVETCALDKGYDVGFVYEGCEQNGARPIIPLRMTPAVKREPNPAPTCTTWSVDVRGCRLQATGDAMAAPHRRMLSPLPEGEWLIGASETEKWKWLNISTIVSVEIHRESDPDPSITAPGE